MITADICLIAVSLLTIIIGYFAGFGKILKGLTKGIFGIIISIFVCYLIYGFVLNIDIVQQLLINLITFFKEKDNFFFNLLLKIRIDLVVFFLVLFLIVQILRKIIVKIIKGVFEIKKPFFKVLNGVFGIVLLLAVVASMILIAFQIVFWINGESGTLYSFLNGSVFKLDELYVNNPLINFIKYLNIPETASELFK